MNGVDFWVSLCRFLGISLKQNGVPVGLPVRCAMQSPLRRLPANRLENAFVLPDIQAVDLLDCNKGGLTQLDQWLLAVKIDLAAASRLIRTGRSVATNNPILSPAFIATGNSTREAEEQVLALRAK